MLRGKWWGQFYKVWTNNVGKPGYEKKDWRALQRQLELLESATKEIIASASGGPYSPFADSVQLHTLAYAKGLEIKISALKKDFFTEE